MNTILKSQILPFINATDSDMPIAGMNQGEFIGGTGTDGTYVPANGFTVVKK